MTWAEVAHHATWPLCLAVCVVAYCWAVRS
jgi:hypothetical protein